MALAIMGTVFFILLASQAQRKTKENTGESTLPDPS
jgi:hypothetical protein